MMSIVHQAETDHEASDTDEDESSSPRADSSSADDDDEEVFYDASDLSRSNSLQASRSLSLPAFEGDSAFDSARCVLSIAQGMQVVLKLRWQLTGTIRVGGDDKVALREQEIVKASAALSLFGDRCSALLLLLQRTMLDPAAEKTVFCRLRCHLSCAGRGHCPQFSSTQVAPSALGTECCPAARCREAVRASDKENIPKWLEKELPPPPRRERLPTPKQREKSVSLWSIIKECVGKDLSRVCLPVFFNEPLSSLQRIAEEMEYSELLDEVRTISPPSVFHHK